MKKLFITSILCILGSVLTAQDITITFQSKVDTVSIDSVTATNLRTNQMVKLLGGESLLLVKTSTSINQLRSNLEMGYIYPNPTDGDATISFLMDKSEEVEIGLYNSNGQLLSKVKESLSQGIHNFSIKFPVAGIYYINVIKRDDISGFKAVFTGKKTQNSSIVYEGSEKLNYSGSNENQLKGATTEKSLVYSEDDIIQYSFFSGVNATIVSEEPTVSKTVDVEFVSCIDNDDRSYKAVKIGEQWWMAENLAYLPSVSPSSQGSYATDPYYYVYGYQGINVSEAKATSNYQTYGVLYNWPAAMNACPPGWHLPTDEEWTALTTFLGGESVAGGKMKEAGTTHWTSPNTGATNEIGFSALPGGYRNNYGNFLNVGGNGSWWSSTELSASNAWDRTLGYGYSGIGRYGYGKEYGFSVRCVRD